MGPDALQTEPVVFKKGRGMEGRETEAAWGNQRVREQVRQRLK